VKHPAPAIGHYRPKYTEIDKKIHKIWDILKVNNNLNSSKIPRTPNGDLKYELEKDIPERLKNKVTGFIAMEK